MCAPWRLGRKNWPRVGSAPAGPTKLAAILSVVESCRRLDIPVNAHPLAVLPGLTGRKALKLPASRRLGGRHHGSALGWSEDTLGRQQSLSILPSFAAANPQHVATTVDVARFELGDFRNPESGAVQDRQDWR